MSFPQLLTLRNVGSEWGEETVADTAPIRDGVVKDRNPVPASGCDPALRADNYLLQCGSIHPGKRHMSHKTEYHQHAYGKEDPAP